MKNFIQIGDTIQLKNASGGDLKSGAVMQLVANHYVAVDDVVTNARGPFVNEGVVSLDATSADSWVEGDTLYWDTATKKLTNVAGSLKKIGFAVIDKAALGLTGYVKLVNKV